MIDIVSAVLEAKKKKIKVYPCHVNRVSELGHPCERYLVYCRTNWADRSMHDVGLQLIFDEGNRQEKAVFEDLREAGFEILEQQRSFEWQKFNITGHIDGKISNGDGKVYPLEIKSFNPWNFEKINTVEDMFQSKQTFMQKYPAQLTLYNLLDNKDEGLFLLKNKVNGMLKQIPLKLDYDYAESLLQKAERINAHIAAGTLPERVPWETGISENCPFQHICLPDHTHEGNLISDPELEEKLDKLMELKPKYKQAKDEYEELEEEVKEYFKTQEKAEAVIGNWIVKGKWVERKGFEVKPSRYWQTSIKPLS